MSLPIVGLCHVDEPWRKYIEGSYAVAVERNSRSLGGVQISESSSAGVFDFLTDEVFARYSNFLNGNKNQRVDPMYIEEDSITKSEEAPVDVLDPSLPTEKSNTNTLDQWFDQIITNPQPPHEERVEDRNFNTANYFKESDAKDQKKIDDLLLELDN